MSREIRSCHHYIKYYDDNLYSLCLDVPQLCVICVCIF